MYKHVLKLYLWDEWEQMDLVHMPPNELSHLSIVYYDS
jgi:hypothetical protein